jgi:hypothetical protein
MLAEDVGHMHDLDGMDLTAHLRHTIDSR